ncbi:MAG: hypothetical protein ABW278_15695 [Steroidobacteraceae bacterium]
MKLVLQIVAAILIANAIQAAVVAIYARQQLAALQQQMAESEAKASAAAKARRAADAARVMAEQSRQQQLQMRHAEQQRAQEQANIERQRADAAKAAAWERFYKAPAGCATPANWNIQVDCGNHFMRERSRFNAVYRP